MDIAKEYNLEDIWRRRTPTAREYTWGLGEPALCIHLWLTSKYLEINIKQVSIFTTPYSRRDHKAIDIHIKCNTIERGRGVWKMNLNVVKSELFRNAFKIFWEKWRTKKDIYGDSRLWWDIGKKKIKELTISCAQQLHREADSQIKDIEMQIDKVVVINTMEKMRKIFQRCMIRSKVKNSMI